MGVSNPPPGAVTPTLVTDHGGLLHAKEYGVVADGSTNNFAALSSAYDALPDSGGDIVLPASAGADSRILFGTGLNWAAKPVRIFGQGGWSRAVGDSIGGPVLTYNGSGAGGTVGLKLGKQGQLHGVTYHGGGAETGLLFTPTGSSGASAWRIFNSKITGGSTYGTVLEHNLGEGMVFNSLFFGADSSMPTTVWVDNDDTFFYSTYIGKGNPCMKVSRGGFVYIGGDLSGELSGSNGTKGVLQITRGNHFLFNAIRFGKFDGDGNLGGSAHVTVEGSDGNVGFVRFDACQWTCNYATGANDGKVDALRIDGNTFGVDRVAVNGGHFRSLSTTEEYRYALDIIQGAGGVSRVVFQPDLVENCNVGLWTGRPTVVGEFIATRIVNDTAQRSSKLARNTTAGGTGAATAETDLQSVAFTRGIIGPTGSIRVQAAGTASGANNTKTIRLYLGATVLATISEAAGSTADWMFDALIISTGASSQKVMVRAFEGATLEVVDYLTAAEDTVGAEIVIKTTGQTANAADEATGTMIEACVES